ncbi:hypothetical protein, partial [Neisseria sp.]|uniref:hypothetical protein n=1 Tax=Neisseria sp. TaxID=192066 RepID=UPI0035A0B830
ERPPPVQPCSEEGELYTTPHSTVNSRQTKITAQNLNPLPNNRIFLKTNTFPVVFKLSLVQKILKNLCKSEFKLLCLMPSEKRKILPIYYVPKKTARRKAVDYFSCFGSLFDMAAVCIGQYSVAVYRSGRNGLCA